MSVSQNSLQRRNFKLDAEQKHTQLHSQLADQMEEQMNEKLTAHGGIKKFFGENTTKETIARVIFDSINAKIPDPSKKLLAIQFMWIWSEFDNKFIGCPYWSIGAIEYFEHVIKKNYKDHEFLTANGKLRSDWRRIFQVEIPNNFNNTPNKLNNKNKPTLTHEHAIPKSFACKKLLKAKFESATDVQKFMEDHARGVVITECERQKIDSQFKSTMPNESEYTWLDRYKEVGIEVYKVNWKEIKSTNNTKVIKKEEIDQSQITKYKTS